MKKFKIILLVILLNILMVRAIEACDLLSINIGGDKSSTAIFDIIEDDEIDEDTNVNVFTDSVDAFCTDIDFGEALVKLYIADNKVGAVEIEVMNDLNNEESKKGLLRAYVESSYGTINTDSEEWNGYQFWDIGGKQIFYYISKYNDGSIKEGVAVTTEELYYVLVSDE